jgi:hypothetical protein
MWIFSKHYSGGKSIFFDVDILELRVPVECDVAHAPGEGAGAAPYEDGGEEAVSQVLYRLKLNTASECPCLIPLFCTPRRTGRVAGS